ncbi:MAG: rod shape-determining protein RodA [Clostridiales bacterium]|nr:rod shape-determining protein RodA [Clostridiales bacterium]
MPGKSGIERLRNTQYFRKVDYYLIVPIFLITVIGLYVLNQVLKDGYEAYPNNLYRQIGAAVIGMVITAFLCAMDTQILRVFGWVVYGVSLFLLILVPIDGYDLSWKWGADSWLNLPVIGNVQPSELMKIGLAMAAGDIFERIHQKQVTVLKGIGLLALTYGPPMLLILSQPDFGTGMVIVASFVCIVFVLGLKYRYFLLATSGIIVIGLPLVWNFYLKDYQKKRILPLIFEGTDPKGEWNLIQSKAAIASGGLTGNHTGVIVTVPVKESDFIYSATSEHLGFIGTTALIVLAFFFLCRCLYVAAKASRPAYSYMIVGLTASFAFHYIENMGMAVGLLPITGIPLPFVSYGGTAMLVNFISFGIILNISMELKSN